MIEFPTIADRLQVGDVIVSGDSETTVREIATGSGGRVTVNPGASDEQDGYAWQNVTVRRAEVSR